MTAGNASHGKIARYSRPGMPSMGFTATARTRTTTSPAAGDVYGAGPTSNRPPRLGSHNATYCSVISGPLPCDRQAAPLHPHARAAQRDQAEAVLRERGLDGLSLRKLAREAGVGHGAPRKHFIDRNALLDALAERGFVRLADEIQQAASHAPDHAHALHAVGSAYVRFAVKEPALLDLMFAAKVDAPPKPSEAPRSAFSPRWPTS
ncbi:TetR/AcrR family transcriptional regulator [Actinomadura bangladeshensis]|uniref:TetR/AcrR family transcriptional regulator n=1 Tax=Actinomadura bangladeshensis TaxID=453573 RepID=UPI003B8A650A